MALWDEVAARYNAQDLIELSRAGESLGSTTLNTTRTDAAVADVTAEFLTLGRGLVLDSADPQHVSVGVEGVILRLKVFATSGDMAALAKWEGWKSRVADLAKYSRAARLSPRSTTPATSTEKPAFEPTRMIALVPDAPPTRTDS